MQNKIVTWEGLDLRGQVAIVTGGSRGIGRAVVERLASLGVHVVVNYANDESAAVATAAAAAKYGVESVSIKANVAELGAAEQLVEATRKRFARIDILVCNAGIWQGAPIEAMTEDLWDRTMAINLKGCWTVCRAVAPVMKAQRLGKVVMVASTAGQRGEENYSNYAASKGGVIAFTKSLAAELAPWKINVNAVAPGWVDTEMVTDALGDPAERERIAASIPLGAIATAEDIAGPIAFLCSDWARHITGEVLNINGGSVLCG